MEDSLPESIDKIEKSKGQISNVGPGPTKVVSELEEAVKKIADLRKADK